MAKLNLILYLGIGRPLEDVKGNVRLGKTKLVFIFF